MRPPLPEAQRVARQQQQLAYHRARREHYKTLNAQARAQKKATRGD